MIAARVWEEDFVIPTYGVGKPGRNPDLFRDSWRQIYPYTLTDDLLHVRRDRTYRAVFLENEYLKVIVLPELGGHVYSAYDKLTGQEMFYRNHVIKPARILLPGSWCAYGIEFNFPRGHNVDTMSRVDFRLLADDDGSAGVAVGACERMSRMRWTVVIRLRPGARRLETTARITNRTDLPHRYYYWANAAVAANDDLQFLSPARRARRWGEDLPFPFQNGEDKRWYKNHPHAGDIFTVDCPHDFFGYYDHGRDFGVVHVADRHILPGKKFFTWGNSPDGLVWADILSDGDGPYIEIQAGSHPTQSDLGLFAPHATLVWDELWYPVSKLGPFDYATDRFALALRVEEPSTAVVRIQANQELTRCTVVVRTDGKEQQAWDVNLAVGPPEVFKAELQDGWEEVEAELRDARGQVLATHKTTRRRGGHQAPVKRPRADGRTPEAFHRQAIAALESGNEDAALRSFAEALKRDKHFSLALRDRGMVLLRRGLWAEARDDLEAALVRAPKDALARYYLAVAFRGLGEHERALDEAKEVAVRPGHGWLGWMLAGELELAGGRAEEAESAFRSALAREPGLPRALALLSTALRRQGRTEEAAGAAGSALEADPLEHLALAELWFLEADGRRFAETLRGEVQSYLEVASDYLRVGLANDARAVLRAYLDQLPRRRQPYPIVHYYLGYLCDELGEPERARKHLAVAAKLPFEYVFPHRIETERVLRAALEKNPEDARARYYLGNLLASRLRADEALELWERAVQLDPTIAPAFRNIAMTRWHRDRDGRAALAAFRKAVAAAPDDQDLYWEFDDILEALGRGRERVKVLSSAPAEVLQRDKVGKRLVQAHYALGHYDKVIKILRANEFWPWEGERITGQVWAGAHMAKAQKALAKGQYDKARKYLEDSMVFPENLHLGRSAYPRFAKQKVLLARCLQILGELEAARENLESAAAEQYMGWDRGYCESQYYKGVALLELGEKTKARKTFQKLTREPPPFGRRHLGTAMVSFLKALGHRGLAELGDRRSHLSSARELITKALGERAEFPEAEAMLAEVQGLLKKMRSKRNRRPPREGRGR